MTLDRVYISCSEKKGPFREETFKLKAGKSNIRGLIDKARENHQLRAP